MAEWYNSSWRQNNSCCRPTFSIIDVGHHRVVGSKRQHELVQVAVIFKALGVLDQVVLEVLVLWKLRKQLSAATQHLDRCTSPSINTRSPTYRASIRIDGVRVIRHVWIELAANGTLVEDHCRHKA
jgi:hypothetical protein